MRSGAFAQYVAVLKEHTMRIPENCDFVKACIIPHVWCTAWDLTHIVAEVEADKTAMVMQPASGIGLAIV